MSKTAVNARSATSRRHWFWDLIEAKETRQSYTLTCIALWSLCLYLIITNFVGGAVEVQGDSMMPALLNGETHFLNRWAYHFRPPRRGEVIVIRDPGYSDFAVKRVVGIPGEQIEIHDGLVFIDGHLFKEPYLPRHVQTFPAKGMRWAYKIPPNHFLVLGDNRDNSLDSRYYGGVHRVQVIGLVTDASN